MANQSKLIKPTWQLHDLNNNIEHELFEDYIVEFTDIAGIEVDYYIRNETGITEMDDIYGEPMYQNTFYNPARRTKVLYDTTEEPTLTEVFGIVSEDQIQYAFMPKFTWSRDVSAGTYLRDGVIHNMRPNVGDLMTTIWNDHNYEIVDVGEEAHIFQLNKFVWEFILRPLRYSEQSNSIANIVDPVLREPSDTDTATSPLTASMGDNATIEEESNEIDNYGDVDTAIYGF